MVEDDFTASYTPFIVKKPKWNEESKDDYQKQTTKILQELSDKYNSVVYIPKLCEMFSKALVISAEKVFDTSNPKFDEKKRTFPYFSKDFKEAHKHHKKVFVDWRKAKRPSDPLHPAKAAVLLSRRNMQKIARDEDSAKAIKLHDDLMNTHTTDINKLSAKLKKSRGEEFRKTEIPFIETLAGKYHGDNVLEGIAANTEILCDEEKTREDNYDNELYDMIVKDNMIIFDITAEEEVKIPKMTLKILKDILFKKLKINKANVVENNEHLGQIVSGVSQEEKNVDLRVSKVRKNLFGLLGAGFSYKCMLSPVVKLHIYKTHTCPILRSGLSSFSLRTAQLEPLAQRFSGRTVEQ